MTTPDRFLALVCLPALLLPPALFATAVGCGGSTSSDNGGSDAGVDVAIDVAIDTGSRADSGCMGCPPPPDDGGPITPGLPPNPGGPPPDGTGSIVLAFSRVYIGDTDRNGAASASAWKQYGLNIDNKITDRNSTDVCTLAPGASKSAQLDGVSGIDNGWGQNILPILLTTAGADAAQKMNDAITNGEFTTMVRLDKVGTQQSYSPLPGLLYDGLKTQSPPSWNGNDLWPVDVSSVNNNDVNAPKIVFAGGYMNARAWVGAPPVAKMHLPFSFAGVDVPIPLAHAQIVMQVAPDGRTATQGTISGVAPTEEYIAVFRQMAGRISTSLCAGSAFESIAQQIRQASDILVSGANGPGVPCDGISLGWGFDAKLVKLGALTQPPTPSPDPCGPRDGGARSQHQAIFV